MSDIATISFSAEAHDPAADAFRNIETYCCWVVPTEGFPFDAFIGPIIVQEGGPNDGCYAVTLYPKLDDEDPRLKQSNKYDEGDKSKPIVLDIYTGIERVRVW